MITKSSGGLLDGMAAEDPAAGTDPASVSFAAPPWLRDLGLTSWFLVGFFALLAAAVWLLGTAATIVTPFVAATIVATVTVPLVGRLHRHRVPRAAGAALILLGLIAITAVVAVLVIGGISGQQDDIATQANAAAAQGESWLESVGVDQSGASGASDAVKNDVPQIISTLLHGVIDGLKGITSLVFGLSLAALCTFFLLKDGPTMRSWVDRNLGMPQEVAETITSAVVRSLRGYFRGVTIVAGFNAAVVTLGALLLGVPLAGTIGIVTFICAYIPYIGAFVAGAFAVVIALGSEGTTTALIMLVIVILANGLLQNVFQPFAMGSALDLNPLVVLVVTIASGCVFGMAGLVLAAPLTSAAVHIVRELRVARTEGEFTPDAEPPLQPPTPLHA